MDGKIWTNTFENLDKYIKKFKQIEYTENESEGFEGWELIRSLLGEDWEWDWTRGHMRKSTPWNLGTLIDNKYISKPGQR